MKIFKTLKIRSGGSACPVGIEKLAGVIKLTSRTAIFISLFLALLSTSCLKPVDFSIDPELLEDPVEPPPPPPAPVVDNPDQGTMTRATADQIFDLEVDGEGLKITGFKSAALLASYLLRSSSAQGALPPDTFTIPLIDDIPVLSIADGAFEPSTPGSNDDITTVIKVLKLPPTIESLGKDLFGEDGKKVKTSIFLDIPQTAPVFQGMDATAQNDKAAEAAGLAVVARLYDPANPAAEPTVVLSPGTEVFTRPNTGTAEYTIAFYDDNTGLVRLAGLVNSKIVSEQYQVRDAALKKLFKTIYVPNAPESTDDIEDGKTTTRYNAAISQAALDLFKIKVGSASAYDRVEIKGTSLPDDDDADAWNPIVIDIGLPGVDNGDLPVFTIPDRGLGLQNGSYAHIRLRVNRGADLIIDADNSGYLNNSPATSCPTGYFNGGCIEVMDGGKLRDAAYQGFPLGSSAVILCRNGSYLAVGPATDWEIFTATPGQWYAGWLIGSGTKGSDNTYGGSSVPPRIIWDSDQGAGKYIEVRAREIAIDAKVTVKRSFGLIYSVWFVNDATLTIAAEGEQHHIFGNDVHGVFANGDQYNFYGTSQTRITINQNNVLDGRFLDHGTTQDPNPVPGSKTIMGPNTGTSIEYVDSTTGIEGIHIPYPSP
jgi:hypothetical protein